MKYIQSSHLQLLKVKRNSQPRLTKKYESVFYERKAKRDRGQVWTEGDRGLPHAPGWGATEQVFAETQERFENK